MNPVEVAESYDQLADKWDSDAFPRDNGIEQHKLAMRFTELRGRALDIGCGSSGRIIDILLEEGFIAEGLDLSTAMLERAKRRHTDQLFHHADICNWDFPYAYDLITAWDSIWHIPLNAQERVLKKILTNLNPGGVFIFTTGGVDRPSEERNSIMGPPMYHSALGINRTLECVANANCACRHLEYDQLPEPHVYLIVQKFESALQDDT